MTDETQDFEEETPEELDAVSEKRPAKIAIVGRPNVGKYPLSLTAWLVKNLLSSMIRPA